jgi:hypothetical protein
MRPILLSFLVSAALASAAPVVYTTLTDWQNAGPQLGTIGFESLAGTGQNQYSSFNLGGLTFSAIGGNLVVYPDGYSWSNLGAGPSLTSNIAPSAILITLPQDVYGIGFLIGSGAGVPVTVTVNGTTQLTIANPTNPPPNVGNLANFWGIRSDTAITSITIGAAVTDYRAIIDNVTWGGPVVVGGGGGGQGGGEGGLTETPEPTSALLIGGALLLVPLIRRSARAGRSRS